MQRTTIKFIMGALERCSASEAARALWERSLILRTRQLPSPFLLSSWFSINASLCCACWASRLRCSLVVACGGSWLAGAPDETHDLVRILELVDVLAQRHRAMRDFR